MTQQMVDVSAPDFCLTAKPDESGLRLDHYLSCILKELSRSQLKKLIKDGRVLVNSRIVKPGYETRSGDQITGWLPTPDASLKLVPARIPLDILFEDDDILVINKEPGLVVHPGAGNREGTLVHGLIAHCPHLPIQGTPLRPGIVHRLDRYTSGAMVIAKTGVAYLDLIRQFKDHKVKKEYLALVYGNLSNREGEIVSSLGRHPTDRRKMAVLMNKGREAISHWKVERAWDGVTLLRISIKTGRTHQIRVQFSHLQHPVVGDADYGGGKRRAKLLKSAKVQNLLMPVERQMLHAKRLAFEHPRTSQVKSFEAPLAPDFASLLSDLEAIDPRSS